jgi:hypothetical protein
MAGDQGDNDRKCAHRVRVQVGNHNIVEGIVIVKSQGEQGDDCPEGKVVDETARQKINREPQCDRHAEKIGN